MMISGASSIASNDFIRIIVVGLLALYSFINHKNLYNNILRFPKKIFLICILGQIVLANVDIISEIITPFTPQ